MSVAVVRNDELRRYEGRIDGALAGFAEYQLTDVGGEPVEQVVAPSAAGLAHGQRHGDGVLLDGLVRRSRGPRRRAPRP
jgi:hypothetical protein